MGQYDSAGRITKTNFIISLNRSSSLSRLIYLWDCICVSLHSFGGLPIGRIAIRLLYQKSLAIDDAFLILVAVFLILALGVLFISISPHLTEALITNESNVIIPSDIIDLGHGFVNSALFLICWLSPPSSLSSCCLSTVFTI